MAFTRKRKLALLIGLVAIVLGAVIVYFSFFFHPQREFTITETYRITAERGSETYLTVCLPVSGPYQEVSGFTVAGGVDSTTKTFDDRLEMTMRIPANGSEFVVSITYTVLLLSNVKPWWDWVPDKYVQPQQYVDSDSSTVIAQAQRLRGENDYETARNILNYVHRTLRAPSGDQINVDQRTASELLEDPVGVCSDNAILMTALLRANGIPARMISGLSLKLPLGREGDWTHPGGSHAWVEFYYDESWHFADPTWGLFDQSDAAHLSYGTYEANINSDFQQNRYHAIEEKGFFIVGAMTAPMMFVVYSTDEHATVVPRASVSLGNWQ